MNNGQATVLAEQRAENLNGILLDARGEIAQKEPHTLMDKIDAKASQDITVKRGTLWFVGTVLILAGVMFSYGSSVIAWVRDDESQKVKLSTLEQQNIEIRKQMDSLNSKFDDIQKSLTDRAIQDAKVAGYQLKAAEGDAHK